MTILWSDPSYSGQLPNKLHIVIHKITLFKNVNDGLLTTCSTNFFSQIFLSLSSWNLCQNVFFSVCWLKNKSYQILHYILLKKRSDEQINIRLFGNIWGLFPMCVGLRHVCGGALSTQSHVSLSWIFKFWLRKQTWVVVYLLFCFSRIF